MNPLACVVALAAALALGRVADAEEPAAPLPEAPPLPNREALEKRFQETLNGAVLTGHFTDRTKENAALPREEKYTIQSVTKLQGDYWLFRARIQYGKHDLTLPLPLRVVWAGDTPVITLDKVPVPGLGTFTARVLIHDGQYAGTWDGAGHGGHLFGRVIPAADTKKDEIAPAEQP